MIEATLINSIVVIEIIELSTGKQIGCLHAKRRVRSRSWKIYSSHCKKGLGKFLYYQLMHTVYPQAIVRDSSDWRGGKESNAARIYKAFDIVEYVKKPSPRHYQFSWHWSIGQRL